MAHKILVVDDEAHLKTGGLSCIFALGTTRCRQAENGLDAIQKVPSIALTSLSPTSACRRSTDTSCAAGFVGTLRHERFRSFS